MSDIDIDRYRYTVDSKKLEYGCRTICAVFPSFCGWRLEDSIVPTFWLRLYILHESLDSFAAALKATHKQFIIKLIVQGLLMLLEAYGALWRAPHIAVRATEHHVVGRRTSDFVRAPSGLLLGLLLRNLKYMALQGNRAVYTIDPHWDYLFRVP